MQPFPRLLARGPWSKPDVDVIWSKHHYVADTQRAAAADRALADLSVRGSPTHDGLGARLEQFETVDHKLVLELAPMRWALRLVSANASGALSALCVTRASDGRWLAGRRASWVATWPGRWTLGAGGSVEVSEHPMTTLERELQEEWSVAPRQLTGEALIELSEGLIMFVGLAWLGGNAEVIADDEHDEYAWWPADISKWPTYADETLKKLAKLISTDQSFSPAHSDDCGI